MAAPELGQKQICPHCSAKFYDLNRRPATCPKCQTVFDPEEALRNRRIRTRAPDYEAEEEKEEKVVEDEAEGFEEEVDETPEIDQAAEAEVLETDEETEDTEAGAAPAPGGEDIGVDFAEEGEIEGEADDEVPFLEDEDEDFTDEDIEGLPEGGEEE